MPQVEKSLAESIDQNQDDSDVLERRHTVLKKHQPDASGNKLCNLAGGKHGRPFSGALSKGVQGQPASFAANRVLELYPLIRTSGWLLPALNKTRETEYRALMLKRQSDPVAGLMHSLSSRVANDQVTRYQNSKIRPCSLEDVSDLYTNALTINF